MQEGACKTCTDLKHAENGISYSWGTMVINMVYVNWLGLYNMVEKNATPKDHYAKHVGSINSTKGNLLCKQLTK